jgi:hypothetical protein
MDEHTPGLQRKLPDSYLRTMPVGELYELANECEVEPADPTICDACAAYLIAQEKKPMDSLTGRVLTDADIEALADEAERGYDVSHLTPRPWLFVPGDRVIVLWGNTLMGGTVLGVQIPGPIRPERVVKVSVDDIPDNDLSKVMWWDPDQIERIHG